MGQTLSVNEMRGGGQTISPSHNHATTSQQSMLFNRAELDGKRLVNNISEMQQSVEHSQLNDVSIMLS